MTVVVWDGYTLAADSRSSSGDTISSDNAIKIFDLKHTKYLDDELFVIGLAGSLADFQQLVLCMIEREWIFCDDTFDIHGIVVGKKYTYIIEAEGMGLIRYPKKEFLAVGTGASQALIALDLGLSAEKTVIQVCKRNSRCGGKVQKWKYNENMTRGKTLC